MTNASDVRERSFAKSAREFFFTWNHRTAWLMAELGEVVDVFLSANAVIAAAMSERWVKRR